MPQTHGAVAPHAAVIGTAMRQGPGHPPEEYFVEAVGFEVNDAANAANSQIS